MRPSVIATLATGVVKADLKIFLFSLGLWNEEAPTVYLMCDDEMADAVPEMAYKGTIHINRGLNRYKGLTRPQMERTPESGSNMWVNFMLEKTTLLDWALESAPDALFCDSDICFMGPLFDIPMGTTLAVSRHEIKPQDEARFGAYNGGMIWVSNRQQVALWRAATATSRFFEQAAIEDVAAASQSLYLIPRTENYGWWRLWQGTKSPQALASEWSAGPNGILVLGKPLGSVHTHFGETRDAATREFNRWVLSWLLKLSAHEPSRRLWEFITGCVD